GLAELQGRCETLREEGELAAKHFEQARKEHEAKLDALFMERERYRIQAFALAKEMDVLGTQLGKISAERAGYLVERDAALAERAHYLIERDAALAERAHYLIERDAALAERARYLIERDAALAERARY